jgi:hypothetical protein
MKRVWQATSADSSSKRPWAVGVDGDQRAGGAELRGDAA